VLLWRCPIQAQVVPLPPQAAVALTVAGFEGVRIIAAALHHCPGPFSCVYGGNRDDVTHFGVPVEELYIYIYYRAQSQWSSRPHVTQRLDEYILNYPSRAPMSHKRLSSLLDMTYLASSASRLIASLWGGTPIAFECDPRIYFLRELCISD
jgi:hypothetical protein